MKKIKSDIEIARSSNMKPIRDILGKFDIPDDPFSFSPMGRHIAKLNLERISPMGFLLAALAISISDFILLILQKLCGGLGLNRTNDTYLFRVLLYY